LLRFDEQEAIPIQLFYDIVSLQRGDFRVDG
jgi:hypothetical protein